MKKLFIMIAVLVLSFSGFAFSEEDVPDFEKAMPLYHEAYSCYVRAGLAENDQLFAGLFNNMASAFAAQNDFDSAEAYYLAAIDILEKNQQLMDAATAYVNLARLRKDSAEKFLNAAINCFNDPAVERNGYYAHTALKCAGAFSELGAPEFDHELRSRAEAIYSASAPKGFAGGGIK